MMQKAYSKSVQIISYLIVGLAVVASVGGLLLDGLYRGTEFVVSTWFGNDIVTLVVGVPMLLGAVIMTGRGSARAQLILLGMLDYMLYNFGFYLFGAAFNWFFFIYVLLFALSIWALILALMSLNVDELAAGFEPRTPARVIAGYMAFVGITLTFVYCLQWLRFATSSEVPQIVEMSGHPTNLVFAMDLSISVPVLLVGSILLWRRQRWGYVLAVMGNVQGAVYMLALSAATLTAFQAGTIDSVSQLGLWSVIGAGFAIAAVLLLRNLGS